MLHINLGFSQTKEAELRNKIKIAKDTILINSLLDLGEHYYHNTGQGDSMISFGKKALKLSRKIGSKEKEIKSLMYMSNGHVVYANVHVNPKNYQNAEDILKQALKLAKEINDVKMQAELHNKFGALYINQGEKLLAIENRLKAAKLSAMVLDYSSEAIAFYGVSLVYAHDNQSEKAIEYIKKAIKIIETNMGVSNNEKFVIYKFASQLYLNLFEEFGNKNYDKHALICAEKSLEIAKQNNFEAKIPQSLSLLCDYYIVKKDFKKAGGFAKQILTYHSYISEPIKINVFEALAEMHKVNNQKTLAYSYLDSLNQLKIKTEPYYGSAISNFSYETYKYFKDYGLAFKAIEEKMEFDRKLKEQDQIKDINELETKYKTDLKNSEIKNLSQQQKINALEIENKQVQIKRLVILLIVASLIIICILFIGSMVRLKQTKQKNKALKLAFEKQIALKKELAAVRENIAQDFHDDLGNRLARISLLSNLVNREVSDKKDEIKLKVKQITEDANELYFGTRDFIFSLKEGSDHVEELATYISDFGESYFSKTTIKFILEKHIEANDKLPYYWSKQLIYIFKEAMTNALKHAKCNKVMLSFYYKDKQLIIECADDGIGLLVEDEKSTNGISNMKARAQKIGGELLIYSDKEKGTTVRFSGKTNTNA
ncbi:ATP-binding protein [Algibacter sp. 2305UL17-15]|uniref:tetratricopeptide repeat-containing sensor histidine kinase n=1 Tax=Algibacter sp. 2305UL17-15 TaxID=3231268 RepID=UPI00345A33A8